MVHFLHLCMTTEKNHTIWIFIAKDCFLPWFMDLTFQVPMWYSLQHWTSLSPPDTSAIECHFCFGPAFSFFLEIFLCSSVVVYWIPADLGGRDIFWCHIFLPFHTFHGILMARTLEWFCHSLLQWTMVCQRSSLQHIHFRWLFKEWLIASLSYASPFTTTRLWSMVVV